MVPMEPGSDQRAKAEHDNFDKRPKGDFPQHRHDRGVGHRAGPGGLLI